MNYWKLGCRWGSKNKGNPLFIDLLLKHKIVLSWRDKDFGKDSTLILTDGHTVIGVAKTTSSAISATESPELEDEFRNYNIDFNKDLLIYKAEIFIIEAQDSFEYKLVQGICGVNDYDAKKNIKKLIIKYEHKMKINNIAELLNYKKQIILQGPPGTGKTRLAKNIFYNILYTELKKEIDELYFREILVMGFQFSFKNGTVAKISKIVSEKLVLDIKNQGEEVSFTYQEVYDCYKDNDFLEKDFVGYNRYAVRSIVSYIVKSLKHDKIEKQFKLIQFHPTYTYEDFVRGIVSKPNSEGDGIVYEAENKTVGLFAEAALRNYRNSNKAPVLVAKEKWVSKQYFAFRDDVESRIAENGYLTIKTDNLPKIVSVEPNSLRINRYSNKNDSVLVKDYDIITGYIGEHLSTPPVKIRENHSLSKSARSGMYYLYQNLILRFKEYLAENNLTYNSNDEVIGEKLKNYVLIIDEINRANLSSVLGELIYALEYRGEEVQSMYEVENSILQNKKGLILPPNLYIIGTMNTADRSVGHIDYAIRRRFAFVDVLPENLKETQGLESFNNELFLKVAELFDTNLSNEFKKSDVQLGHSYFIDKSQEGGPMDIRFEYEIKPILLEYVKDGVLVGSVTVTEGGQVKEIPVEDYIHSLY